MFDAEHLDRYRLLSWRDHIFLRDRAVLPAADDDLAGHQIQRLAGTVQQRQLIDVGAGLFERLLLHGLLLGRIRRPLSRWLGRWPNRRIGIWGCVGGGVWLVRCDLAPSSTTVTVPAFSPSSNVMNRFSVLGVRDEIGKIVRLA